MCLVGADSNFLSLDPQGPWSQLLLVSRDYTLFLQKFIVHCKQTSYLSQDSTIWISKLQAYQVRSTNRTCRPYDLQELQVLDSRSLDWGRHSSAVSRAVEGIGKEDFFSYKSPAAVVLLRISYSP